MQIIDPTQILNTENHCLTLITGTPELHIMPMAYIDTAMAGCDCTLTVREYEFLEFEINLTGSDPFDLIARLKSMIVTMDQLKGCQTFKDVVKRAGTTLKAIKV